MPKHEIKGIRLSERRASAGMFRAVVWCRGDPFQVGRDVGSIDEATELCASVHSDEWKIYDSHGRVVT